MQKLDNYKCKMYEKYKKENYGIIFLFNKKYMSFKIFYFMNSVCGICESFIWEIDSYFCNTKIIEKNHLGKYYNIITMMIHRRRQNCI